MFRSLLAAMRKRLRIVFSVSVMAALGASASPVPRPQIFVGEQNPERIPSLLAEKDLLPPFGKGEKQRQEQLAKIPRSPESRQIMFSDMLTRYVISSYSFLGDFRERERPVTPPGWILPKDNLKQALQLADPHMFERPKVDIILPVFRIMQIPFLKGKVQKGEDATTFRLNTTLNYWRSGDSARAKEEFDKLAQDVIDAKIPHDDPTVLAAWALRGFFYLELLSKQVHPEDLTVADLPATEPKATPSPASTPSSEKKGAEVAATPAPPSPQELAEIKGQQESRLKELREKAKGEFDAVATVARDSFVRVFLRGNLDKYFGKVAFVDKEILNTTFDCPLFLEPRGGVPVSCSRVPLQRNTDPMDWVKATAVSVLWNSAVMQRQLGDWTGVFDYSDLLFDLMNRFDAEFLASLKFAKAPRVAIVPAPLITASAPYGIWPRNEKDMVAALLYLRAFGFEKARDRQEILRSVDVGIRKAASSDLVALGFLYAGNTYSDLNSYALARRAYAWCEASSELFSEKIPGCLLYGAESAFWEGNYGLAAGGFEKFLKLSADKTYAPWAHYRLALIAHLKGRRLEAEQRYAEIMRLYPAHAVYVEALVRNTCLQIAAKDANFALKQKFIAEVEKEVEMSRVSLKLHASTCLLQAKLENATEEARTRSRLAQDAKTQLSLLESYEKAFPLSPYMPLFEERAKDVKLAFVVQLADENACPELEKMYEEQALALEKLGARGKNYLPSLEWGAEERKIVMRCAALTKNLDLWAKIAKSSSGKDGGLIQRRLFEFMKSGGQPRQAVMLARAVEQEPDMHEWLLASQEVSKNGKNYVRNGAFWQGVSLDKLIRFFLSKPASQTADLKMILLRGVEKRPRLLFENDILCGMAMPEISRYKAAFWDELAKLKKSDEWLLLLGKDLKQAKQASERCAWQVAGALLVSARSRPSRVRDGTILLPYLHAKGVAGASDDWLAYVQRLEQNYGVTAEVRAYYERLSKEASSPTIQKVSRLWLESHASGN
jgi:hypothetical protein